MPDYLRGLNRGVKGVRIGIDRKYVAKSVHPEIRKTLERAVKVLASQGATILSVKKPAVAEAVDAWAPICAAEAAVAHAETYPARKKAYSAVDSAFLDGGLDYARAEIVRGNFRGQMAALFQDIDLMVTPVMGMLNPRSRASRPSAPRKAR